MNDEQLNYVLSFTGDTSSVEKGLQNVGKLAETVAKKGMRSIGDSLKTQREELEKITDMMGDTSGIETRAKAEKDIAYARKAIAVEEAKSDRTNRVDKSARELKILTSRKIQLQAITKELKKQHEQTVRIRAEQLRTGPRNPRPGIEEPSPVSVQTQLQGVTEIQGQIDGVVLKMEELDAIASPEIKIGGIPNLLNSIDAVINKIESIPNADVYVCVLEDGLKELRADLAKIQDTVTVKVDAGELQKLANLVTKLDIKGITKIETTKELAPIHMAAGGVVPTAPGVPKSTDRVKAELTAGEYVMPAPIAEDPRNLEVLNAMRAGTSFLNVKAKAYTVDQSKLSSEEDAQVEFKRSLDTQYPDGIPLFHESPIENLDSIIKHGLISHESAGDEDNPTNFATVGKPSGFVSGDKVIVQAKTTSKRISPDMRYVDPDNKKPDAALLLSEHSGTEGADVAYEGRISPKMFTAIHVVRDGKVIKSIPFKNGKPTINEDIPPGVYETETGIVGGYKPKRDLDYYGKAVGGLLDFSQLPKEYKSDLEENGMGMDLNEIIVANGKEAKRVKKIRGEWLEEEIEMAEAELDTDEKQVHMSTGGMVPAAPKNPEYRDGGAEEPRQSNRELLNTVRSKMAREEKNTMTFADGNMQELGVFDGNRPYPLSPRHADNPFYMGAYNEASGGRKPQSISDVLDTLPKGLQSLLADKKVKFSEESMNNSLGYYLVDTNTVTIDPNNQDKYHRVARHEIGHAVDTNLKNKKIGKLAKGVAKVVGGIGLGIGGGLLGGLGAPILAGLIGGTIAQKGIKEVIGIITRDRRLDNLSDDLNFKKAIAEDQENMSDADLHHNYYVLTGNTSTGSEEVDQIRKQREVFAEGFGFLSAPGNESEEEDRERQGFAKAFPRSIKWIKNHQQLKRLLPEKSHMSTGGMVPIAPGIPRNADDVLISATAGEYVMPVPAVNKPGNLGILNAMRAGATIGPKKVGHYATGGIVNDEDDKEVEGGENWDYPPINKRSANKRNIVTSPSTMDMDKLTGYSQGYQNYQETPSTAPNLSAFRGISKSFPVDMVEDYEDALETINDQLDAQAGKLTRINAMQNPAYLEKEAKIRNTIAESTLNQQLASKSIKPDLGYLQRKADLEQAITTENLRQQLIQLQTRPDSKLLAENLAIEKRITDEKHKQQLEAIKAAGDPAAIKDRIAKEKELAEAMEKTKKKEDKERRNTPPFKSTFFEKMLAHPVKTAQSLVKGIQERHKEIGSRVGKGQEKSGHVGGALSEMFKIFREYKEESGGGISSMLGKIVEHGEDIDEEKKETELTSKKPPKVEELEAPFALPAEEHTVEKPPKVEESINPQIKQQEEEKNIDEELEIRSAGYLMPSKGGPRDTDEGRKKADEYREELARDQIQKGIDSGSNRVGLGFGEIESQKNDPRFQKPTKEEEEEQKAANDQKLAYFRKISRKMGYDINEGDVSTDQKTAVKTAGLKKLPNPAPAYEDQRNKNSPSPDKIIKSINKVSKLGGGGVPEPAEVTAVPEATEAVTMVPEVTEVTGGAEAATGAMAGMGTELLALAGPIGLAVAGIAAAVEVVKILAVVGGKIVAAPIQVFNQGLSVLGKSLQGLTGTLGPIGVGFDLLGDGLGALADGVSSIPIIGDALGPVLKAFAVMPGLLKGITETLIGFAAKASPAQFKMFQMAVDDVQAVIGHSFIPVMNLMRDGIRLVGDVLINILPSTEDVQGALSGAATAFDAVRASVLNWLSIFGPGMRSAMTSSIKGIADMIGSVGPQVLGLLGGPLQSMGNLIGNVSKAISELTPVFWSLLKGPLEMIGDVISSIINFGAGLVSVVTGVGKVLGAIMSVPIAIGSAFAPIFKVLNPLSVLGAVFEAIGIGAGFLGDVLKVVFDPLTEAFGEVKDSMSELFGVFSELWSSLKEIFASGAGGLFESIKPLLQLINPLKPLAVLISVVAKSISFMAQSLRSLLTSLGLMGPEKAPSQVYSSVGAASQQASITDINSYIQKLQTDAYSQPGIVTMDQLPATVGTISNNLTSAVDALKTIAGVVTNILARIPALPNPGGAVGEGIARVIYGNEGRGGPGIQTVPENPTAAYFNNR